MSRVSGLSPGGSMADEQRNSSFQRSVAPLASDMVKMDLADDGTGGMPQPAEETTEATDDDSGRQKYGQRNKYDVMRRQDLIDLYLTLSRRREELLAQLTNISNVILELSEDYHDLKSRTCVPCYFSELDRLIQESLAAYERRANQTVMPWSDLISNEAASKIRERPTVLAEQTKRMSTELYDIPIRQLRNVVIDLESDIAIYQKRMALDDKKIRTMGEQWAHDKRGLCCLRYCFLRRIIEAAITEYRVDHK